MVAAGWLWLGLGGCTSEVVETEDPPVLPSIDSGTPQPRGWAPTSFTVQASFAVDREAATLRTFFDNGTELAPLVAIRMFDASGDLECRVNLIMDDAASVSLESWVFEDATEDIESTLMTHVGFTVPAQARVTTNGCEDVDPDYMPDPGGLIASKLWGVGVGTLRSDVQGLLEDKKSALADTFWAEAHGEAQLAGGSWVSDIWEPSTWASHMVVAGLLSAEGELQLDEDGWPAVPLPYEDIILGGNSLPDGHYFLVGVYTFSVAQYLLP
ncbi:MAG: hypothetical protein AAGA48_27995 [Myxococcota bacterium]